MFKIQIQWVQPAKAVGPWAADFQLPGYVLHVPRTSESLNTNHMEKAQKTLNSAAMQFPLCKSFASLSQGREQPYLAMLSVGCVLDEAMRTIFYLDTVVDLRRSNLYEMAFHKHWIWMADSAGNLHWLSSDLFNPRECIHQPILPHTSQGKVGCALPLSACLQTVSKEQWVRV